MNVAIRKSINKAGVPVKAAVVAVAPSKHGYLKQSIRIKSKFYKNSKTWALIVGPSSSFSRIKKKPKPKASKIPKPKKPKPPQRKKKNKTLTALQKQAKQFGKKAKLAGKALDRLGTSALKNTGKALGSLSKRRKSLTSRLGRLLKKAGRKKRKSKPAATGQKVRPAYYSSIVNFGSVKFSARRFVERALSMSANLYATLLTSALREEIARSLAK